MSQSKITNPSAIALLILPSIILTAGLVMIGYMSPIYAGVQGLDYDPAYQYLFNGAGLMQGYSPFHVDHPGTPVQILTGLISIASWSVARMFALTSLPFPASVAANPEEYLRVIMTVFLVMNCMAIYWLGSAIARSMGIVAAGIACQTCYLLLGFYFFPRMINGAPEAILCLAATGLMSVLAPVLFADDDCSDRRALAAGFFVGLGVVSKMIFFPMLLLTLLLKRPRPIIVALIASFGFTFVFLSPVIRSLKRVFEWLFAISTHSGHHGEGAAGFIDWSAIPERLGLIASTEPLLVVAAISVTAALLFSKSGHRLKGMVLAATLGALIFMVIKHFSILYLMPAVAISPVIIVWSLSRFARQHSYPYWVATAIAAIVGGSMVANISVTFANDRALRRQNEKAINEVIARYQNPVVIGAYRSGYKPWAVLFALAWVDPVFAGTFPQTNAADSLSYHGGLKKPWRAHSGPVEWDYLDQFEKAGRAVLIVQSKGEKIGPETARTETLLDQGFGDTVERIIVSPKAEDR